MTDEKLNRPKLLNLTSNKIVIYEGLYTIITTLPSKGELRLTKGYSFKKTLNSFRYYDYKTDIEVDIPIENAITPVTALDEKSPGYSSTHNLTNKDGIIVSLSVALFLKSNNKGWKSQIFTIGPVTSSSVDDSGVPVVFVERLDFHNI